MSITEQRHAQFQIAIRGWEYISVIDVIFVRKNRCTASEHTTHFIDIQNSMDSSRTSIIKIILSCSPRVSEGRIISIRHKTIAIDINNCIAQRLERVNFFVSSLERRRYLFTCQRLCTSFKSLVQKRKEPPGKRFFA